MPCLSPRCRHGAPPSHARPPFAGAVPESRRAAAHGTQEVGEQLSELISVHSTNNHPFPCGPHPPSAAGPIMQCNNHSTSRRASSKGAVCLSAGTKTVAAPFAPRTPSAWPVSVWPTALCGAEERVFRRPRSRVSKSLRFRAEFWLWWMSRAPLKPSLPGPALRGSTVPHGAGGEASKF